MSKPLTREDLEELIRIELSKVLELEKLQEDDDDAKPLDGIMEPFRKLGRGVMQEDYFIIPKRSLIELMRGAKHSPQGQAVLASHLNEAKGMNPDQIKAFCNQQGFRTYEHFLQAVSNLSKAQKGKLGD